MFIFKITLRTQKERQPRACVHYLCVRVCAYVGTRVCVVSSTLHVQTVDCCGGTCCPLETLYINLHNNINVSSSLFPLPTYGSADLVLLLLFCSQYTCTSVSHLSSVEWRQFLKAQSLAVQGRMM